MKSIGLNRLTFAISLLFVFISSVPAQENRLIITDYLSNNFEKLGLTESDMDQWHISDAYKTKHNEVTHVHIQQQYNNVDVFNSVCNFALDGNNKVVYAANSLQGNLRERTNAFSFLVNEEAALNSAMQLAEIADVEISERKIEPIYYHYEGILHLSYHTVLTAIDKQHVWNVIVDGLNGRILDHWDQVIHCSYDNMVSSHSEHNKEWVEKHQQKTTSSERRSGSAYNVFAVPVESPNHGIQSVVVSPEDSSASPYGWHDNDGQPGADFTFTRGNNVFAFEDADNNGPPGYSPDGGEELNFNFSYTDEVPAIENQDAALTNLFYMNNIIHDVLYAYGFDEVSGNFQDNNYDNGGTPNDEVFAQGFDGGGVNNATFFTPQDGFNPTMSMFLWNTGGDQEFLTINSPEEIQGSYLTSGAAFGPGIPNEPLTADVIRYVDGVPPFNDACQPAVNGPELAGKIALIDRVECTFVDKILEAQDAGAVGVIMVNNVAGDPITMGGASGNVLIPSVMIAQSDGSLIKAQLEDGQTVNATIVDTSEGVILLDGNFDNGIIAHEYGHGISNRLIGGRFNTNCMNNMEQMGEGWSDWYAMMLTLNMAAENPVNRPIGTYVVREPITGDGIRPVAYDTSMAVNPYTYGNLNDNNISIPHGIGFIWSTMLWDLTWAFIDEYGYDPDVSHGSGGNNIVMQLITDGLKFTSCSPGFVNGRDGILIADQMNNDGANRCLIYKVFARRGLGYSANQGFTFNVGDGTEAFDLPPECINTIFADFLVDQTISCDGNIQFSDASIGEPTSWLWDFGDGNTSEEQNPEHQYLVSGTYTVTLTVSNGSQNSNIVQTDLITIAIPQAPTGTMNQKICQGETAELTAVGINTIQWYDGNDNPVGSGSTFTTPALEASTLYFASDLILFDDAFCESEKVEVMVTVIHADFSSTSDELTFSFEDLSINPSSWLWDFSDGTTSTEQNPIHNYASPGMYDVVLTIDDLCTATTMVNAISTGIEDIFEKAGLTLVPNPARNSTIISSGIPIPKEALIQLVGLDGRTMQEIKLTKALREIEIDLEDVAEGMYQIVISLDHAILIQKKLIVSKP